MQVHLVDGTYELFRHYYGLPRGQDPDADPVRAARGTVQSVLGLLEGGVTHIGVATDHVIESFRNDLWAGYKTGLGVPEVLFAQFGLLEDALRAMGVKVFAMVEMEADDALAAAAKTAAADPAVEQVVIMTPDKDLAQCVEGDRVVQMDRRADTVANAAAVEAKYGVAPASIPDWLALVGDSADGFPGLKGWGKKGAATVLQRYGHLENIPRDIDAWDLDVRGASGLSATFNRERDLAFLFRDLATLRADAPVIDGVDELRWAGPPDVEALSRAAERMRARGLVDRVVALMNTRATGT
jgi:5'-3' exonuclease